MFLPLKNDLPRAIFSTYYTRSVISLSHPVEVKLDYSNPVSCETVHRTDTHISQLFGSQRWLKWLWTDWNNYFGGIFCFMKKEALWNICQPGMGAHCTNSSRKMPTSGMHFGSCFIGHRTPAVHKNVIVYFGQWECYLWQKYFWKCEYKKCPNISNVVLHSDRPQHFLCELHLLMQMQMQSV